MRVGFQAGPPEKAGPCGEQCRDMKRGDLGMASPLCQSYGLLYDDFSLRAEGLLHRSRPCTHSSRSTPTPRALYASSSLCLPLFLRYRTTCTTSRPSPFSSSLQDGKRDGPAPRIFIRPLLISSGYSHHLLRKWPDASTNLFMLRVMQALASAPNEARDDGTSSRTVSTTDNRSRAPPSSPWLGTKERFEESKDQRSHHQLLLLVIARSHRKEMQAVDRTPFSLGLSSPALFANVEAPSRSLKNSGRSGPCKHRKWDLDFQI